MDIFEVVAVGEIPGLLKVFEKDWPKYYPLNQFVKIFGEYKQAEVTVPNQTLYRHGDVENGVYLMETIFPLGGDSKVTIYFIYTASDDLSGLREALLTTSRIPWTSKGFYFEVTFDKFVQVVCEVGRTKAGLEFNYKHNTMMWLPKPVDCSPVPEDMHIVMIDESHLSEINSSWPHKFPGSEIYLANEIKLNFGLGLFRKSDKKLVSSTLSFHSGGIFVLFTDPEFRGKGYAEIIVRSMATELHRRGRIPFATILHENIPSQKLFTKIGFQHLTNISFIVNL